MRSREKPCLVYDGDCGFCKRWVARWKHLTGDKIEYRPSQSAAKDFPDIPREKFSEAVQLVEPDGKTFSGAEAVFRALSYAPRGGWGMKAYRAIPGFKSVSEALYRLVARHRVFFSRLTALLWGPSLEPPRYRAVRWVFLRGLGLIYLFAFASLGAQVIGLAGDKGILPVGPFLKAVAGQVGRQRFWLLPTFCWLNASDLFLRAQCWAGAGLSLLLLAGVAQAPVAALLWALYLSLSTACQVFLGYQWDILLLETGFLAIFLAPIQLLPRIPREAEPPRSMIWLLRWLLFRLMFSSGMVKLLSGDPAWRSLSALNYHYETQPLPTWIGWYAHQLPARLQKLSTGAMFAIELGAPFLIWLPRRPRLAAAAVFCAFMGLVFLTGNYCFFNLLTVLLCASLFDDAALCAVLPRRLARLFTGERPAQGTAKRAATRAVAAAVFVLGCVHLWVTVSRSLPGPLVLLYEAAEPLRSVNGYGLFAVMTHPRGEIVVEGSNDLKDWRAYEFKWKPGDPKRRPGFVAPHQPRLDWQMWFAALGSYQQNPWFMNFLGRLLQGEPAVLRLLENNPFPGAPPRYVRALFYEYHFTDFASRRVDGSWWRRELKGLYCPVISLKP